jgi:hypothetical protein
MLGLVSFGAVVIFLRFVALFELVLQKDFFAVFGCCLCLLFVARVTFYYFYGETRSCCRYMVAGACSSLFF